MAAFSCAGAFVKLFGYLLSRSPCAREEHEWAVIADTPQHVHMLIAREVAGLYVVPGMKLVALPSQSNSASMLESSKINGNQALTLACEELAPASMLRLARYKCYQFHQVNANGAQAIELFAERFPTEFENTADYLKDFIGIDMEPVAQLPEESATTAANVYRKNKYAGAAISATFLVNLVTLIGVFFIPVLARMVATYKDEVQGIVCGFAAALMLETALSCEPPWQMVGVWTQGQSRLSWS